MLVFNHCFLLLSFALQLEQFGLVLLDGLVLLVYLLLEGSCYFVVVFVVVVDGGPCFLNVVLSAIDFCYINASLESDALLTDFRA